MDLSDLNTTTALLTPDQVRQLTTENTQTEAYEFVYDTPTRKLTAAQVATLVPVLLRRVRELKRDGRTTEQIRATLCEDEDVRLFASDSHPRLFRRITNVDTPDHVVATILRMIGVARSVETGEVSEQAALTSLQTHLLKACTEKSA